MFQTQPEWNYAVIRVKDADVSVRFYEEFTGMSPVSDARDGNGKRWMQLRQADPSCPTVLVLEEVVAERHGEDMTRVYATIGFRLSDREGVDRLAALAAREDCLTAQPYDGGPFRGYLCTVADPDGNHLDFFCPAVDRSTHSA